MIQTLQDKIEYICKHRGLYTGSDFKFSECDFWPNRIYIRTPSGESTFCAIQLPTVTDNRIGYSRMVSQDTFEQFIDALYEHLWALNLPPAAAKTPHLRVVK